MPFKFPCACVWVSYAKIFLHFNQSALARFHLSLYHVWAAHRSYIYRSAGFHSPLNSWIILNSIDDFHHLWAEISLLRKSTRCNSAPFREEYARRWTRSVETHRSTQKKRIRPIDLLSDVIQMLGMLNDVRWISLETAMMFENNRATWKRTPKIDNVILLAVVVLVNLMGKKWGQFRMVPISAVVVPGNVFH